MKVRCNWCMKVFEENEIIWDEDEEKEQCPKCGTVGCLMDLVDEEDEGEDI